MLYRQRNYRSQGKPSAVAKRAALSFALGFLCLLGRPVFADENGLIEAQNKVDIARKQLLGACQQQRFDLRQSIVESARDTMAKRCEKDSDCPSVSVSTQTTPSGDAKTKDSDKFNFHFAVSVYKGKPEPVLTTDSGAPTTLEKLVRSKLDKVCVEILNNDYQDPKFYVFTEVPYQAPEELNATVVEDMERARRALNNLTPNYRAGVAAGSGSKGAPVATGTDQGLPTSPRDDQAPNSIRGAAN